jgi:hypothetical protein
LSGGDWLKSGSQQWIDNHAGVGDEQTARRGREPFVVSCSEYNPSDWRRNRKM